MFLTQMHCMDIAITGRATYGIMHQHRILTLHSSVNRHLPTKRKLCLHVFHINPVKYFLENIKFTITNHISD